MVIFKPTHFMNFFFTRSILNNPIAYIYNNIIKYNTYNYI